MPKKLLYLTSTLGLLIFILFSALALGIYAGWVTPENLRRIIKYNPMVTSSLPIVSESQVQTVFYQLKRRDVALASMGQGFITGGGAFTEISGGILIGEKSGRFFFLDEDGDNQPRLRQTSILININQEGFNRELKRQGYAIKSVLNVGYAGLGMRLHDLLLLGDRERLMVSYTRWNDNRACAELVFAVSNLHYAKSLPTTDSWREVFKTSPCLGLGPQKNKPFAGHQAGGRMIELKSGQILITVGDFKNDGDKRSISTADPNNSYGKTHLIDLNTQSIQKNYSVGHRNPQGLMVRSNGEIWSTEHGPTGGDELNLILEGSNYGWPMVTLGKDCGGCEWQKEGRHEGYEKPQWAFLPSIGISNLIEIRDFAPIWDGDLLVSSLKAETLYRIRLDGVRPIYASPIHIGERIRDIIQLRDRRIALWTDSGKMIFLELYTAPGPGDILFQNLKPAVREVVRECSVCHALNPTDSTNDRLSLWGIVGRGFGSDPTFNYSKALSKQEAYWTKKNLDKFLESPVSSIPGTTMAYNGIADDALRTAVIDFLAQLK